MTDHAVNDRPTMPPVNPLADDNLPMRCADCGAFNPTPGNAAIGVCRGVPPTPIMMGLQKDLMQRVVPQLGSFWPTVDAGAWCMQFRRRPPAFAMPVSLESPSEGNA